MEHKITFFTETFNKSLDLDKLGFEQAKALIDEAMTDGCTWLNLDFVDTGKKLSINMPRIIFIDYE